MDRDKILNSIKDNISDFFSKYHQYQPAILSKKIDFVKKNDKKDLLKIMKLSLKQVGADYKELGIIDQKELEQFIENNYPDAVDFTKKNVFDEYPADCSKDELNLLNTVILSGQFGVAENGAIWIDDSNFPNRLIPFISTRLIIFLDSNNIVSNMHEAYNRIKNNNIGFGLFISGPSKTADIEQSLVYGAHGATELTVLL